MRPESLPMKCWSEGSSLAVSMGLQNSVFGRNDFVLRTGIVPGERIYGGGDIGAKGR